MAVVPGWQSGHDEANDDLYGTTRGQGQTRAEGYYDQNYRKDDPRMWGGKDYDYRVDDQGRGVFIPGSNGASRDVDRYRGAAADAQKRQAVQLEQSTSNEARGYQLGALGLMRGAAEGSAPSRAAALGDLAGADAIRSAAGNTVARGPGAGVVAMRNASGAAAGVMGNAAGQAGEQRAAEIGQAQRDYFGGATGVRTQDQRAAITNAQLQAQQSALNDSAEMFNERLGWQTNEAAMFANNEIRRQDLAQQQAQRDKRRREEQAAYDAAMDGFSTLSSAATSDERAKRSIRPMGSLARFGGG